MKKKLKNKETAYIRTKTELYESFLFHYLPQISALSYVTRFNLYDAFGTYGTNRAGSQGSPVVLFEALRKQRHHQMRKKAALKPFSLTLLHPHNSNSKTFRNTLELIQQKNALSNTCKLATRTEPIKEGFRQLIRLAQQQPASEKHLLFIDPLGIAQFSFNEILSIAEKKIDIIICLPLAALWQLHTKTEKIQAFPGLIELKQLIDNLFPADHPYWAPEIEIRNFVGYLTRAWSQEDKLFTILEPTEIVEKTDIALVGICSDAFMMEKMLQALQALRPETSPPPGQQLGMFGFHPSADNKNHVTQHEKVLSLLSEEPTNNQQLYINGLKAGLLPGQLMEGLDHLLTAGSIKITDAKNKFIARIPAGSIGYTAYRAAQASCFFSLSINNH